MTTIDLDDDIARVIDLDDDVAGVIDLTAPYPIHVALATKRLALSDDLLPRPNRRRFRRDVEGLRAWAVLLVVAYHMGVSGFSGGYVGVDVFFVVSGFLITEGLLLDLHRERRISFGAFYSNRFRRLIPAASVVVVVTLLVSRAVYSPLAFRAVARDGLSSAAFVSNLRFAAQSTNYLGAHVASPFQQFWSLAVEEQFYLVWPFLIGLASLSWWRSGRMRRSTLAAALSAVTLASFVWAFRETTTNQPLAFFSLPSRAWELAIGGLLALFASQLGRVPTSVRAAAGWIGLAGVAIAAVTFTATTRFPGPSAALPVLGTACVVAAGMQTTRFGVDRLLGIRPFRIVGRLSYSIYLWHWPLLILAAEAKGSPLTMPQEIGVVEVAIVIAVATYWILETPLRSWSLLRWPIRRGIVLGVALSAIAASVAYVLPHANSLYGSSVRVTKAIDIGSPRVQADFPRSLPSNLEPSLADVRSDVPRSTTVGCLVDFSALRSPSCTFGDPQGAKTVVLYGDSYAEQWFPALDAIARDKRWRLIVYTKRGCPVAPIPVGNLETNRTYSECDTWRSWLLHRLDMLRPDVVIVSTATTYLLRNPKPALVAQWRNGFLTVLQHVAHSADHTIVIGDPPDPGRDVPDCVSKFASDLSHCDLNRNDATITILAAADARLAAKASASFVNPVPWFCTERVCGVVVGRTLVYRDERHLTPEMTELLKPQLEQALQSAL